MSNIETALQLMGIGMVTVFIILILVVLLGNAIILIVNRIMPQVEVLKPTSGNASSGIGANKVAAIVAAVKQVTNGKGNVVNIEKQ